MAHNPNHPTTDFSIEKLLCDDKGKGIKQLKQRRRSSFTALQVHWLEAEFRCHRYVSPERRAGLAALLGLTQQQIKIWFQNRRYKTKFRQSNLPPNYLIPQPSNPIFYSNPNNSHILKILHRQPHWTQYFFNAPQKKLESQEPQIDNSTDSQQSCE